MKISIQKPLDQPAGVNRLMEQIKANLSDDRFDSFRFIVAFAKSGPFLRLEDLFGKWMSGGKSIETVFGVDEKGTSQQALEFALANFSKTYISHISKTSFSSTFHPKLYMFTGKEKGVAYIGSNNFTVGGLETNAECNVCVEFDISTDQDFTQQLNDSWDTTIATSLILDKSLLNDLVSSKLVVSEKEMVARRLTIGKLTPRDKSIIQPKFPSLPIAPPSPIPRTALIKKRTVKKLAEVKPILRENLATQALAIQIIPHRNGEILLSKIAVNQNPAFFGFPFTGATVPKKSVNPSYPQRDPDPIVKIVVHGSSRKPVVNIPEHSLNMVYYETRSEIRITVPQDVIKNTPPYSIMILSQNAADEGLDYSIDIFVPDTDLYNKYLASCNQEMPGGGNETPRRFGWI